jgi:hypothetical protein
MILIDPKIGPAGQQTKSLWVKVPNPSIIFLLLKIGPSDDRETIIIHTSRTWKT